MFSPLYENRSLNTILLIISLFQQFKIYYLQQYIITVALNMPNIYTTTIYGWNIFSYIKGWNRETVENLCWYIMNISEIYLQLYTWLCHDKYCTYQFISTPDAIRILESLKHLLTTDWRRLSILPKIIFYPIFSGYSKFTHPLFSPVCPCERYKKHTQQYLTVKLSDRLNMYLIQRSCSI